MDAKYAFALRESTLDVLFSEYRRVIKYEQDPCFADMIEDEIKRRFEALTASKGRH